MRLLASELVKLAHVTTQTHTCHFPIGLSPVGVA